MAYYIAALATAAIATPITCNLSNSSSIPLGINSRARIYEVYTKGINIIVELAS